MSITSPNLLGDGATWLVLKMLVSDIFCGPIRGKLRTKKPVALKTPSALYYQLEIPIYFKRTDQEIYSHCPTR